MARTSTLYPVKPSVAIGAVQRSFNPSALVSATNFDGASTAATGADDSVGSAVVDSVGSAVFDIDGVGAAPSSLSPPD